VEVGADLHLRPYYGVEDDTDDPITHKPSGNCPRFARTRRSVRVCGTDTTRWRYAILKTAAVSSSSSLAFPTALVSASRQFTLIGDPMTASVSRCSRHTTTPTSSRSSDGVKRFSRNRRNCGVASFSTREA
jgi:hypothetical protein